LPTHIPSATLRGPFFAPDRSASRPRQIRESTESFGRREAEELPMTPITWIMMFLIMAFIWGGFSMVLVTAIRKESGKNVDS
jgi:hypothetical protein